MSFERQQALGEVAEIVSGQSPAGSELTEAPVGVPFFQGAKDFGARFPSERIFTTSPKKLAQPGDVLLSVRAPVGRVNRAHRKVAIGRGLFALRGKPGVLLTDYLEYVLRAMSSRWGSHESTGSVFSNLSRLNLASVVIQLPSIDEQRAIAEVLGSLDDAIENHLAQHRGRVALLVSLGPATRCETIVGGFELTIGGDWGADEPDDSHTEAVLCLRGKDLEDLLAGAADDIPVRYLKPSSVKKRQLQSGDVLTAGSGTLGPTLLITESLLSGFSLPLVYSNFVKRIRASSSAAEPAGLFSALHGMWKSGAIDQFRTGTAMPNLDAKALVKNVETSAAFKAVPNEVIEDLLSFDDVAAVRTLQSIRDALLPKLVSGEVRIKDPERLLDQAA